VERLCRAGRKDRSMLVIDGKLCDCRYPSQAVHLPGAVASAGTTDMQPQRAKVLSEILVSRMAVQEAGVAGALTEEAVELGYEVTVAGYTRKPVIFDACYPY
jgi:hypothetical protein